MKTPHLYDDLAESRRLINIYPVDKHYQIRTRIERRKTKVIKLICAAFMLFLSSTYLFPEISDYIDNIHVQVWLWLMVAIMLTWFGIWCIGKTHIF